MRTLNFACATIQIYRAANLGRRTKRAVPQAWLDHPVENLFPEEVHALAPAKDNEIGVMPTVFISLSAAWT